MRGIWSTVRARGLGGREVWTDSCIPLFLDGPDTLLDRLAERGLAQLGRAAVLGLRSATHRPGFGPGVAAVVVRVGTSTLVLGPASGREVWTCERANARHLVHGSRPRA